MLVHQRAKKIRAKRDWVEQGMINDTVLLARNIDGLKIVEEIGADYVEVDELENPDFQWIGEQKHVDPVLQHSHRKMQQKV